MEILCGDYSIKLQKIDSKSEMKEVLAKHKKGAIELEEPEYHCECFILSYRFYAENERFGIGIYSETPEFSPKIVSHYSDNEILIIYNNHLTLFNLGERKICFSYASDSVIYFSKFFRDTIVLVSELSIVQLRKNGDVYVTHTLDDVLESFEFEGDAITCRTMSSCTTKRKLVTP